MDDIQFYDAPSAQKGSKNNSKRLLVIIIVLLVLAGVALGASRYFAGIGKKTANQPVTPTATPYVFPTTAPEASGSATPSTSPTGSVTPTGKVTPTTSATKGTTTVAVQNGSGTPGAASKMAATLKSLGYTVASTGNADVFTYQGVTVEVKSTEAKLGQQLKTDLSSDYTVSSVVTTLPVSSATDAVVIVGK